MNFLTPSSLHVENNTKPFSDNPKTLKRQPVGSWKPVTAIGAARQTLGVDKIAMSKADVVMAKIAKHMPHFEDQHRPAKAKEVFHALKKEHPEYSAGKKARIANAMANKTAGVGKAVALGTATLAAGTGGVALMAKKHKTTFGKELSNSLY
jgi:hypothetical protein